MLSKARLALELARRVGLRWLIFRVGYALRIRTGMLARRMPIYRWQDRPLVWWLQKGVPDQPAAYHQWRKAHSGRFFFTESVRVPHHPEWQPEKTIAEADNVLAGKWRYFSHTVYDVGFPPNWHRNPMTGQTLPVDCHWSHLSDFAHGDIKLVWEASRFSVVYTLVRAYKLTDDDRYAEGFWTLIEDWAAHNPPNTGPNWKCGQEASFRIMAWCFGLYGFSGSPCSTPERIASLAAMLAAHADRIEQNIAYARSQKNNHAISEGMGLWTIGLLFPEFRRSTRWRALGKAVLEDEARRQIYADGAYVQHSMNYHRLMLHDYLWALRLGELNHAAFSPGATECIKAAVNFLFRFVDMDSGGVPNYGSNDGALLLPFDCCDYTDYRPVIQAGTYLFEKTRVLAAGPWDEDLFWLFGESALESRLETRTPGDFSAGVGGYYTFRDNRSWAMIRCANYVGRPSQADQMHFDLWWNGINIACDAGTYLYNGQPPWNNGLVVTAVHNTVVLGNHDQMSRRGPFLWLDWPRDTRACVYRGKYGRLTCWVGESRLYTHVEPGGVLHRRGVLQLPDGAWLVLDCLPDSSPYSARLHWLLKDFRYTIDYNKLAAHVTLETPAGQYAIYAGHVCGHSVFETVRAEEDRVQGWESLYYADKQPALSLAITAEPASPGYFWTLFTPVITAIEVNTNPEAVIIRHASWHAVANVQFETLINTVELSGTIEDRLEIRQ